MELGGVIIVAAIFALFGLIPLLVARRTAITQNRENDRFSEHLRLLTNDPREVEACGKSTGPLLARKRTLPEMNGGVMAQPSAKNSATRVDCRGSAAVKEIARLRARRAARLAAEAAAGRRRLLVSAILAFFTLIVAGAVVAASISWAWTLIPASLLTASLVASRIAAIHSEKIGAAELELLNELRTQAPERRVKKSSAPGGENEDEDAVANEPPSDSAALSLLRAAVEARANEVIERPTEAIAVVAASRQAHADELVEASAEASKVEIEGREIEAQESGSDPDPIPATASVERCTWSVKSIPAPSYAMRGRVVGRAVHADTDLRGIPKVDARVPARPLQASVSGANALSTEDVVADQAVALDLDSVLDSRRAQ